MNITVVGRHFELTDPIKEHMISLLKTLEKYQMDIIDAKAIITGDEKGGKKGFVVEFTIVLAHANTIVIKQRDKDVYAAADLAIDRANKVLKKHHDKSKDHKNTPIKEMMPEDMKPIDGDLADEVEIVPMDLELHKPLEVEDALQLLRESNQQFLVFNDHDNKMRVMYKRADGKVGLY
jgi:putative sigma-54 modulation protein